MGKSTVDASAGFGLRDKLAYAAGDFGCNMSFALKGYLTIYWTQFMGIDNYLMASLLRDRMDGVIDCSPFGCRTGFHLITWGTPSIEEVTRAVVSSLEAIADQITWDDVPGTDIVSCGNYRDHSLFSAKEWARAILDKKFSIDPFVRTLLDD